VLASSRKANADDRQQPEKRTVTELENTIGIFDRYASQYQEKYVEHGPYVESYEVLVPLVREGATVLDVACGPGNISKFLNSRITGLSIHGTDLSAEMIKLAKINIPAGKFEVADSRDIKALNRKFDVVIAGFCFPYLTDVEVAQFIADVSEMINPQGAFYISTMDGNYDASGYPANATDDRLFTYYHSAEFLQKTLEANKFEVLRLDRIPFMGKGDTAATDLFIYCKA